MHTVLGRNVNATMRAVGALHKGNPRDRDDSEFRTEAGVNYLAICRASIGPHAEATFEARLSIQAVLKRDACPTLSWSTHATRRGIGLLCPRIKMIYQLIEDLQQKAITVSHAWRTLEVRRSGYYAADKHAAQRQVRRQRLPSSARSLAFPKTPS